MLGEAPAGGGPGPHSLRLDTLVRLRWLPFIPRLYCLDPVDRTEWNGGHIAPSGPLALRNTLCAAVAILRLGARPTPS